MKISTMHSAMQFWLLVNVLSCCYAVNVTTLLGWDPTAPKSLCMDLVVVADTSCSFAKEGFLRMQRFMTALVDGIEELGPSATRIGVATFDQGASVVVPIDGYTDKQQLKNAITFASFKKDSCRNASNTDVALQMVREDPALLGGEKVENRIRIMIMITASAPFYEGNEKSEQQAIEDTIAQAKLNKEDGITGIVVMVRNSDGEIIPADKNYIFDEIASAPLDKHKFAIDDLADGVGVVFKTLALHKCPHECSKELDIVFVLDRSDSTSPENIDKTKTFFKKLATSFTLGPNTTLIAMISYNSDVYPHFNLTESNNANIDELIDDVPVYTAKYAETHRALKFARKDILARSVRVDATKVSVVATDGATRLKGTKSEFVLPIEANPTIKEGHFYAIQGFDLVFIGVPDGNGEDGYDEWIRTATDPDPNNPEFSPDDNIFNLQDGSSFDDLISIAPYVAEQICSLAP